MRIDQTTGLSRLKTSACSSLCLLAVFAAILSASFAFQQESGAATPPEPDFADQIRGLHGVSTLEVAGHDSLPEEVDATVLANQAAAYRTEQPVYARTLDSGLAEARIVATAHHQAR